MSDVVTWIGLSIIVALCLLLFLILIVDLLKKNIRKEGKNETAGEKILSYFSEQDKSLD